MKAKTEAVGLTCTDLVLDHSIYVKTLQGLQNPNNVDLKEFINLRMGGFHACRIFLEAVSKKCWSTGLHDLIVEVR